MGEPLLYSDPPTHSHRRALLAPLFRDASPILEIGPLLLALAHHTGRAPTIENAVRIVVHQEILARLLGVNVGPSLAILASRLTHLIACALYSDPTWLASIALYDRALAARQRLHTAFVSLVRDSPLAAALQGMDGREIMDEFVALVFAGASTTESAVRTMVYLACLRKDDITPDHALHYCPPVAVIPRMVLNDTGFASATFHRGEIINVDIDSILRAFPVEHTRRWAFGFGPKRCIGERIAIGQLRLWKQFVVSELSERPRRNLTTARYLSIPVSQLRNTRLGAINISQGKDGHVTNQKKETR
jgi:cytochrome P450